MATGAASLRGPGSGACFDQLPGSAASAGTARRARSKSLVRIASMASSLECRSCLRFRPADAAMLQAESRQQRRHADRRADALDHRHAELPREKIRLDMDGAEADAMGDDEVGARVADEAFRFAQEGLDQPVL